ncbi:hypothetical protein FACS1894102_2640 [Spirochaetia bacterium]|nr:hypothetical protein FACS1894102_2640 [Spirochaetia bacterium]
MISSLYIHIPFCLKKCDYCSFFSVPIAGEFPCNERNSTVEKYLSALYKDIKYQLEYFKVTDVPSVYIGGGSPSVLGYKSFSQLLDFINSVLPSAPLEWTVELNPETTQKDFLEICKNNNVNRVSIGVQSFNEDSLSVVGRMCNTKKIEDALQSVCEFFPNNFSADLISGLPHQNLCSDLEKLLKYKPSHISLYDLTVEDGTPLQKNIENGRIQIPEAEEKDEMWIKGRDLLEKSGYMQYEVSAFCKEGKESLHNLRYWQMQNWIGCGAGASGTIFSVTG